ncbi:MAG: c-type cytochrome [Hyphomicrobiaceae bacterium]|nr:c-type cytochrome [Hyphomicrobiaceae bacterium]
MASRRTTFPWRRHASGGFRLALVLAAVVGSSAPAPAQPARPGTAAKAAGAPVQKGPDLAARIAQCKGCHGEDGTSPNPAIPTLGGQPKLFVMYQLFFFREGRRNSPEMNEAARALTDRELDALSDWVASLPRPAPDAGAPEPARMARGEALAAARHCGFCHNPDYSGREQMPRLAGQREAYMLKAFREYQQGTRVGTQAAMAEAVRGLSDADLADLAHYLSRLP